MTPDELQNRDSACLFIYGTLKRGHCRAPMLRDQQFLRTARTAPEFRLFNCGTYPGLVPAHGGGGVAVEGELWVVDRACLARLDMEEGLDVGLYQRSAIQIPGVKQDVECYFYLQDVGSLQECGNCWTLDFERSVLGH